MLDAIENINIRKTDDFYMMLTKEKAGLINIINRFNHLNKNYSSSISSAIIDIRVNCTNYITEISNRIKASKGYKADSININKPNTCSNYFDKTLKDGLIISEELIEISYLIRNKKRGRKVNKIVRLLILPDNYMENEIYKTSQTFNQFREDMMNYLLNIRCLKMFDTGIIQFPHPGGEHLVDKPSKKDGENIKSYSKNVSDIVNSNEMPWNDAPLHRRKYLCVNGKYVINDCEKKWKLSGNAKLVFWGEWEPQSKIIEKSKGSSPRYLHQPIISKNTDNQELCDLQNTDPYIFGKDESDMSFYYCCCKQVANEKPTQMQQLKIGNIILFGSYKKGNKFLLDTVFVVGDEGQSYSKLGNETLQCISDTYRFAVIDKVRKGNQNSLFEESDESKSASIVSVETNESSKTTKNCYFTLYKSASYTQPINDYFSFFPCKVYVEGGNNFHPRVELDLNVFGLGDATQGAPRCTNGGKINKESDNLFISHHFIRNYLNRKYELPSHITNELDNCIKEITQGQIPENYNDVINKCYWYVLVSEVIKKGYYLGVYAEEPKFR